MWRPKRASFPSCGPYSTDTPEPDWIAEEDLIISAGEDPPFARMSSPTGRDRTKGRVAGGRGRKEGAEARIVEPEAVEAQVEVEPEAEVVAVASADPWPEIAYEEEAEWQPRTFNPRSCRMSHQR